MMALPTPGNLFAGRFRLQSIAGKGGFGTVYESRDMTSGEVVAVKVFHPDRGDAYDPRTRARFEREASILSELTSPHTIVMYDHGMSESGLLFMVFEWLDGKDLSAYLNDRGRLDADEVILILDQLLESLGEAHHRGLLHRDVKPDNIRIIENRSQGPVIKLLDFGLARALDDGSPGITATGELVGTPRYMSPEQILNNRLTPASDIYSLGIVALELVMGSDALPGNQWGDQLDRLVTGHVFAIPENDGIGRGLLGVIQRMTARSPAERFQSVGAVQHALGLQASTPKPALRASSDGARVSPPRSRLWLVLISLLAVIVIVVLLALQGQTQDRSRTPVVTERPAGNPLGAQLDPATSSVPPTPDAARSTDGSSCEAPFIGVGQLTDHELSPRDAWPVYIPTTYNSRAKHPLVVFLPETGTYPQVVFENSMMREAADRHGYVVVGLQKSMVEPWKAAHVEQIKWIIDQTATRLCIDESRIFAVGHGSAGLTVDLLSCSGRVAATANFAFGRRTAQFPCDSSHARPHMLIAPMASKWEPLGGGENCHGDVLISPEDAARMLRNRNNCSGEARPETKGDMTCRTWRCDQPTMTCERPLGRPWPGVPRRGVDVLKCDGEQNNDPLFGHIFGFFDSLDE